MRKIDIVIADDHPMVRYGIKQVVAACEDMSIVGEASSGTAVLRLLHELRCDVVLLDLSMPDISGIELIKEIGRLQKGVPILVLSMYSDRQFVVSAIRHGAVGYVAKGSNPEVLVEAIRKVSEGGQFIDPTLVEVVIFPAGKPEHLPEEILSAREMQILKMFSSGIPLGDIAGRLCLSPKTISTYKARIMFKLDIDNNADLIRYAERHHVTTG